MTAVHAGVIKDPGSGKPFLLNFPGPHHSFQDKRGAPLLKSLQVPCRAQPAPQGGCRSDPVVARISWHDNAESESASKCIPFWHRPGNRTGAVTQFTDSFNRLISLQIPVNPPYLGPPKTALNEFNIPKRNYYTTQDVCKVLGIKPDTFRYRLRKKYYPEPIKVNEKRRFTVQNIREIVKIEKERN